MRNLLFVGAALVVAGCTTGPQPAPIVSWQYGTGAGEGSKYGGPAPQYGRVYGMGAGEGSKASAVVAPQYSWGADGMSGNMIQLVPQQPQMLAAPAPAPASAPATTVAPGTHS